MLKGAVTAAVILSLCPAPACGGAASAPNVPPEIALSAPDPEER